MSIRIVYAACALWLGAAAALALAEARSAHGPIASLTDAPAIGAKPAELNCTLCHFNPDSDNLNTPGGAVEILGLPGAYETGRTYEIMIRLHSDSTVAFPDRVWGFQLTAVRADDGEGAGVFVLPAPDTLTVIPGSGPFASRAYVEHQLPGTREGLGGPVSWTFSWRAPDSPSGTVLLFASGTAGDGSQDPGGDFVYTASRTVLDASTPVRALSWGQLKRLYR